MNIPNKITLARICMIPLFLIVLMTDIFPANTSRFVSLAIFLVAAASDWLDGYIARKYKLETNFGKLMDPMADKLLVCAALIAFVGMGYMQSWMLIVIISREFFISGVRLIAAEQGHVISASNWGKLKTTFQMILIIAILLNHENIVGSGYSVFSTVTEMLKWLTILLTVGSAVEYIIKNIDVFRKKT